MIILAAGYLVGGWVENRPKSRLVFSDSSLTLEVFAFENVWLMGTFVAHISDFWLPEFVFLTLQYIYLTH